MEKEKPSRWILSVSVLKAQSLWWVRMNKCLDGFNTVSLTPQNSMWLIQLSHSHTRTHNGASQGAHTNTMWATSLFTAEDAELQKLFPQENWSLIYWGRECLLTNLSNKIIIQCAKLIFWSEIWGSMGKTQWDRWRDRWTSMGGVKTHARTQHKQTSLQPLLYMKGRVKATPVRTTAKTIMVRWTYREEEREGGLFKP